MSLQSFFKVSFLAILVLNFWFVLPASLHANIAYCYWEYDPEGVVPPQEVCVEEPPPFPGPPVEPDITFCEANPTDPACAPYRELGYCELFPYDYLCVDKGIPNDDCGMYGWDVVDQRWECDADVLVGTGNGQRGVEGFVFNDLNRNGIYAANEPALPGHIVIVYNQNSSGQTVTDANGYYQLLRTDVWSEVDQEWQSTEFSFGTPYTVQHTQKPARWDYTNPTSHNFNASAVLRYRYDFGIAEGLNGFDYSLSNSGNSSVAKNNDIAFTSNTITKTLLGGTSQEVTLKLSGVPAGTSYGLAPNSCNPTCTSTVLFSVSSTTPAGAYSITVTGLPLSKTTTFNLIVSATPIAISCTPSQGTILLGQNVTWTGNVSGGNPPFTYAWSGTNIPTNPAPSTNPYTISYNTIGQKNAVLTVTDEDGLRASCPAGTVLVNFNPVFEEF